METPVTVADVCGITVQSINLNGDKCGQAALQTLCDFMPEELIKTQQKQSLKATILWLEPICVHGLCVLRKRW